MKETPLKDGHSFHSSHLSLTNCFVHACISRIVRLLTDYKGIGLVAGEEKQGVCSTC